jgi:hypothetical protein
MVQYGLEEFLEMNTSQSGKREQNNKKIEEKKEYRAPKIVYREAFEVSAAACSVPGKPSLPCTFSDS